MPRMRPLQGDSFSSEMGVTVAEGPSPQHREAHLSQQALRLILKSFQRAIELGKIPPGRQPRATKHRQPGLLTSPAISRQPWKVSAGRGRGVGLSQSPALPSVRARRALLRHGPLLPSRVQRLRSPSPPAARSQTPREALTIAFGPRAPRGLQEATAPPSPRTRSCEPRGCSEVPAPDVPRLLGPRGLGHPDLGFRSSLLHLPGGPQAPGRPPPPVLPRTPGPPAQAGCGRPLHAPGRSGPGSNTRPPPRAGTPARAAEAPPYRWCSMRGGGARRRGRRRRLRDWRPARAGP